MEKLPKGEALIESEDVGPPRRVNATPEPPPSGSVAEKLATSRCPRRRRCRGR